MGVLKKQSVYCFVQMSFGNQEAVFHEVKNIAGDLFFTSLDQKKKRCGELCCSRKDLVAMLISCAASKFRKLDDWSPYRGGKPDNCSSWNFNFPSLKLMRI